MIVTSYGLMEPYNLKKQTGSKNDDVEATSWEEYWMGGNLNPEHTHTFNMEEPQPHFCPCGSEKVHRSVKVHLKTNVFAEAIARMFR